MFKIVITLRPIYMQGVKALDERRRLSLPDGATLSVYNHTAIGVDVPESFARLWFGPESLSADAMVDLSQLAPVDVKPDGAGGVIFADLETARACELFVSAQFRLLRQQRDELNAKLTALSK